MLICHDHVMYHTLPSCVTPASDPLPTDQASFIGAYFVLCGGGAMLVMQATT